MKKARPSHRKSQIWSQE